MFTVDEQTIQDLEIFGSRKEQSVFQLFNETDTKGGEESLFSMLGQPLTDVQILRNRVAVLQYLGKYPDFPVLDREELKFIEIYLNLTGDEERFSVTRVLFRELRDKIKPDNELNVCRRGVKMLGRLLFELYRWASEAITDYAPPVMLNYRNRILQSVQESELKYTLEVESLNMVNIGRLDYFFRKKEFERVRKMLDIVYELDALKTIARVAQEQGWTYPEYTTEENGLTISGMFHPFLKNPVKNDFILGNRQNVCFLTGPNMAGKSTYMKAVGIAVYLAHAGFPVPAEKMKTAVFQGLFSTINLSDDIGLGYSHYFSEVQRVKFVAEKIAELKRVVVIFDELFRGTNVKDALDASLAVISAFAGLQKCKFVISTHILEVAERLISPGIDFRCLEIENRDGDFHYTFRLKPGVSNERIGMYILKQEKVIETILNAREIPD